MKGIGAIIVGALIIIAVLLVANETVIKQNGNYDVTCKVVVQNNVGVNMVIVNTWPRKIECSSKNARAFSMLDWLYDSGNLWMQVQGKEAKVRVAVPEVSAGFPVPKPFGERTYKLTVKDLNPGKNTINFYLYDDDGKILSSSYLDYNVGEDK